MASNKDDKIWAVAYINRKFIDTVEEEIELYDYDVEAYIPTVKVLTKKFKGKNLFEFVPLLFNYGFFKVSHNDACNPDFLMTLRHRITCIYAWVKDPAALVDSDPRLNISNENFDNAIPRAAIATDEEVAAMVDASDANSIFTQEDLKRIQPGEYIVLEGYPFEGMPAEIIKIDHNKKEVTVKLLIDQISKNMRVSFDNVFYSIYKNYDEQGREKSTDEIKERFGENAVGHITFKNKLV